MFSGECVGHRLPQQAALAGIVTKAASLDRVQVEPRYFEGSEGGADVGVRPESQNSDTFSAD
jgi:hypothetical protein